MHVGLGMAGLQGGKVCIRFRNQYLGESVESEFFVMYVMLFSYLTHVMLKRNDALPKVLVRYYY